MMRLKIYCGIFLALGLFIGLPYFLQAPPGVHDRGTLALGLLAAGAFFTAGMLFERINPNKFFY